MRGGEGVCVCLRERERTCAISVYLCVNMCVCVCVCVFEHLFGYILCDVTYNNIYVHHCTKPMPTFSYLDTDGTSAESTELYNPYPKT